MSEDEIRAIEIEAAKVMGWQLDSNDHLKHKTWGLKNPQGKLFFWKSEGQAFPGSPTEEGAWMDYTPKFARDPAAVLSALEWLMQKRNVCLMSPKDGEYTAYPIWLQWPNSEAWDGIRRIGDTTGVAICRAIVVLGKENKSNG